MNFNKKNIILILCFLVLFSCDKDTTNDTTPATDNTNQNTTNESYSGSGSISQGLGTTVTTNLFTKGQRVSPVGTIKSSDGKEWTVPAEVNFNNASFPTASDLYNDYGNKYTNTTQAIAGLDANKIIEIDADGEVITAFVFADNYFEMYVNGIAIGKDPVPFTQFNSCILQFKVKRPFVVSMKLVDWEEKLGIGCEVNQGSDYHPGDGGMIAVFKDKDLKTIGITDETWKARVFYIAPISDLKLVSESNFDINTSKCATKDFTSSTTFYALHWEIPANWNKADFDDTKWPNATTYTNDAIGVNNKPSYTNFTDIFDDSSKDAKFIWSSNVILDNAVIVRKKIE